MRSELHIRLRRHVNGVVAASGSLAVPPYWCRWDGTTLWLVGSAATPVGDDDISLHLEVGEGVTATVRSVAATVVYAASGDGTRLHTHLRVGAGADLRWQPDPVIVTARARHRSSTTIEVDPEGSLLADELVDLLANRVGLGDFVEVPPLGVAQNAREVDGVVAGPVAVEGVAQLDDHGAALRVGVRRANGADDLIDLITEHGVEVAGGGHVLTLPRQ